MSIEMIVGLIAVAIGVLVFGLMTITHAYSQYCDTHLARHVDDLVGIVKKLKGNQRSLIDYQRDLIERVERLEAEK